MAGWPPNPFFASLLIDHRVNLFAVSEPWRVVQINVLLIFTELFSDLRVTKKQMEAREGDSPETILNNCNAGAGGCGRPHLQIVVEF